MGNAPKEIRYRGAKYTLAYDPERTRRELPMFDDASMDELERIGNAVASIMEGMRQEDPHNLVRQVEHVTFRFNKLLQSAKDRK